MAVPVPLTLGAGTRLFEGAGLKPDDISFENMYDGFSLFHVFHLEGLRSHGIGKGDALDAFQGDISINGPFPISPSGGGLQRSPSAYQASATPRPFGVRGSA